MVEVRRFLPKTRTPSLLATVLLCVLFCVAEGVLWLVRDVIGHRDLPSLLGVIFWFLLAAGLWLMHPFARKVMVTMLWFFVVLLSVLLLDLYLVFIPTRNIPPVWELLLFLTVVVLCLFRLQKGKGEFVRFTDREVPQ